jgi:crossover junction endodeoxyribonuclease RuvC
VKILGIDPGLRFTGWGVIIASKSQVKFVDCGFIATADGDSTPHRLSSIYKFLTDVIEKHKPDVAVVEETFVNKDPKGALKLGYARGIALMVPALYGLEVFEYAPTTIKKTVAGNGHATKDQVQAMLKFIIPELKSIKNDATDAISIALCHAYHKQI